MQVGKTKDQGLHNKPSAAVRPGALAAGSLPQYNNTRMKKKTRPYCKLKRQKEEMCEMLDFIYTLIN